jgi:RND family efflux transporter MFP subunit
MKRLTLLLTLLLLSLTACAGAASSAEATPTAVPTPIVAQKPTYSVALGTVVRTLRLQGRVAPVQQQDLFFRTDGYVKEVYVARGDVVAAGDVLARLDEPEKYASDIAAAQIEVEKARYDLDELIAAAPVQAAEAQVAMVEAEQALREAELKRTNLDYSRTNNPLVVENAHTDYLLAKVALKEARKAYDAVDHKRETNPERVMALKALLDAQKQYDVTFAIWNWYLLPAKPSEIAQADAELALAQAKYDEARDKWELLKEGPDPHELRLAEAHVSDTEARLAAAQKALEAIELRAPFDGQILSMGVSPGSQVTAFRPVLTLSDPATLEIVAYPASADLSSLGVDQVATVQLTSRPGSGFAGRIRQVPFAGDTGNGNETANQDQTVRITLDDPSVDLVLDEVATILVQLEVRPDVLWLPPEALRTFQGRDFVFVDDNGVQRRIDVRLGLRSDERVEILEGLRQNQTVIGP